MLEARTFSISDLQQESGFDRRTIVYYLQQGLLPKPGRRGPRTRYPEECLVRLRFVRGLKDLQDQGRFGTLTLADIRALMDQLDAARMRALLERFLPPEEIAELQRAAVTPIIATPPSPPPVPAIPAPLDLPRSAQRPTVSDGRSYGLADAGIRRQGAGMAAATRAPSAAPPASQPDTGPAPAAVQPPPQPGPPDFPPELLDNLGELLRQLELRPALTGRRQPPGAAEQWTEIPITSRVYLSVRGLSENDAPLADAAGRALKKLLRSR